MTASSRIFAPILIDPKETDGLANLARIKESRPEIVEVDAFESQLQELYSVRNPSCRSEPAIERQAAGNFVARRRKEGALAVQGKWAYYPWRNLLTHLLAPDEHYEIFTSRNRDLITPEEQGKFRRAVVGIAGLSVGNSVAVAIALEGCEHFRLADFDELSLSNLNRVRGSVCDLGVNKAIVAARQIYEINPYLEAEVFDAGLKNAGEIREFVDGCDVLVDEMDDIPAKFQLRRAARELHLPVVSATDNGDGVIVDIERFDFEPEREIFHGRIPALDPGKMGDAGFADRMKIVSEIVGPELVTRRAMESFKRVGKDLYAWPQLGGAAMLSGAVLAYVVRGIVLNTGLKSGKYNFNPDIIMKL